MTEMFMVWSSGFVLGLLAIAYWMIIQTKLAVQRAERKLDALLQHHGIDLTSAARLTGASLGDAKSAVERLQ